MDDATKSCTGLTVKEMDEIYKLKKFSTEFMLDFDKKWNEVVKKFRREKNGTFRRKRY